MFVPQEAAPVYQPADPMDAKVMDERQARQERLADQREAEGWLPVVDSMPFSPHGPRAGAEAPAGVIPPARARGPPTSSPGFAARIASQILPQIRGAWPAVRRYRTPS